ncbi:TRAP transporter large permease subunit [Rhodoferax saidenbachensis]|uniref:TRAP C4-dicarboxylate transport system permease DctM subunit domain-containing protein n=1 Tax=Rhodoferax saidenbachensis TaxID=1484693 RepID=A0A1P8K9R8_9BURK|nr:TRAP transporter large permease subunit [Rhodoferax saidenbachensis]APW42738.1 hypothetical protein RS694_09480 [Rhodoferax saidenbachensis]
MSTGLAPFMGLAMLVVLAVLILATGLPVWALLIACASLFAAAGCLLGGMDAHVLAAVGVRTMGLLEHDLLQALPLYVLMGVLLQRLHVADAVYALLQRLLRRTPASGALAALGVGALIAPMNGSVASSASLLSRLVAPRLRGLATARAMALVSASATIGVVVPPSLVLILLGDAMLRAHTEASNLPGYHVVQRIINTQDVFLAALLPAMAVLVLWFGVAWWQGRKPSGTPVSAPATTTLTARQGWAGALAIVGVIALLASVFTGKLYAVEAAATGAMVLLLWAALARAMTVDQWQTALQETMELSGALFALLLGANTFSLVFRLWGTDQWLATHILASPWPLQATAAAVLLGVALCAWVLDAFEMIFVIIPIVAPPLVLCLGDAQQAAVLLLLVLQISFLIPPMGYAVMMARTQGGLGRVGTRALLTALLPYWCAQVLVSAVVFAMPSAVHGLDAPPPAATAAQPSADDDIEKSMREMSAPAEDTKP